MKAKTLASLLLTAWFLGACQSSTPPPPPGAKIRLESLQEAKAIIEQSTLAIVPLRPRNLNLFDRYAPNDDVMWSRGWPRKIDMTGVATDTVRTCTLISPRHVLMAQHYQRDVGETVVFHDRRGRRIVRLIEERIALPGGLMPDISVGRLERETPVTFYKVLPPRADYDQYLRGALAVVTDKDRNLLVRRIGQIKNRRLAFMKAHEFPDACADPLIIGDSGNPGFLIIQGQPVLVETHTFGGMGQGPFVSDPENYAGINEAMRQLGGGYQLTPIEIGPGSGRP